MKVENHQWRKRGDAKEDTEEEKDPFEKQKIKSNDSKNNKKWTKGV